MPVGKTVDRFSRKRSLQANIAKLTHCPQPRQRSRAYLVPAAEEKVALFYSFPDVEC